jgi:histo-blood group ABO system transferase
MKILLFTIASGKYYDSFIIDLYQSMKQYVQFEFDFICFSDNTVEDGITKIQIQHLPFPLNTLLRYEIFTQNADVFKKYDYVFYLDADMKIVGEITKDIVSDSVNVLHPGFYEKSRDCFAYEKNEKSLAYVDPEEGTNYYQGCFQGGRTDLFLKMCYELRENIRKDLKNNIIAEWWDESHMNRYKINNPPTKILLPDYALPSEWLGVRKECITEDIIEPQLITNKIGQLVVENIKVGEKNLCNINYESTDPKILHIKKNHESIRTDG